MASCSYKDIAEGFVDGLKTKVNSSAIVDFSAAVDPPFPGMTMKLF